MSDVEIPLGAFPEWLGIEFTVDGPERCEAKMPLGPEKCQPWGFIHGGITLSLLETVASRATERRADLEAENPFGIDVHVRHRKGGKPEGVMFAVAELDREEECRGGRKCFWNVTATDEAGDVISSGTVMTKIVSKEYLARRNAERAAAKA